MHKKKESFLSKHWFSVSVAVLVLVIVIVGSYLLFFNIKPDINGVLIPVYHIDRSELEEYYRMLNEYNSSLNGFRNESMVKSFFIFDSVALRSEDGGVSIGDYSFGPERGFVDDESGKVFHFLNATLLNGNDSALDCSIELKTTNGENVITEIHPMGVVSARTAVPFSLVLFPIEGDAELSLSPVCS
jgi:hypothetical protein